MSYIYIVSLALIVFFSFSLMTKTNKTLSERIFMGWIFLLAFTVLGFFLHSIGLFSRYLLLFSIICDTHVLHAVFFYFYVRSFLDRSFRIRPLHFLNLLPFFLLLGLKWYFNSVMGVMDCYGTGCIHHDNRYVNLLTFLKFFILGGYIFAGWYQVNDLNRNKQEQSKIQKIRSNWIENITIGVFILFSASAVYKALSWLGFGFLGDPLTVINILVSFFIIILLYMGNNFAYLFVPPTAGESITLDAYQPNLSLNDSSIKKADNELEIEDLDKKFCLIEKFIQTHKPYLEGQYTVRALAGKVGIAQNEISPIIQQKTDKYYCDYMNELRVETLKDKLDDPENDKYTIFSLAMDCGFASKTSYNRIFKNHTGLTPTEYREQQKRP